MALESRYQAVLERYQNLTQEMADGAGSDAESYTKLSKEYADISPIAEQISGLLKARNDLRDIEAILADSQTEPDMRALATDEYATLKTSISELEQQIHLALLPKDEADARDAIIEVRAGTGGEEAALFAATLFRMYLRYAENHQWRVDIVALNETGIGGCKEAIASISGRDVFARLKFESGTHRVQRIPETESGGRIHTSAATVAVLPEADEVDVTIDEKDLRIDVYRASGPGGQSVNTTDSAVRITHNPSGIVVQCQDEKSQHKNKAKAMKVLRSRLYEAERQAAADQRAATRKSQIGSGDRSERIRTYNFPQGRVTDHRIGLTLHKLEGILSGDGLDEVIEALSVAEQARRLADSVP